MDTTAQNCFNCSAICTQCAEFCLVHEQNQSLGKLINLCRDCSRICVLCASLLTERRSDFYRICSLCIKACEQCAQECDNHLSFVLCKRCSEACQECVMGLHKMIQAGC